MSGRATPRVRIRIDLYDRYNCHARGSGIAPAWRVGGEIPAGSIEVNPREPQPGEHLRQSGLSILASNIENAIVQRRLQQATFCALANFSFQVSVHWYEHTGFA